MTVKMKYENFENEQEKMLHFARMSKLAHRHLLYAISVKKNTVEIVYYDGVA